MCWDSAPRYICRHEYSHPNPHSPTWQCSNHAECDGSGATCPVYKKSVRTNAPDKDQTSNIICWECRSAASSREGMRRICINIVESEIIEERNDFLAARNKPAINKASENIITAYIQEKYDKTVGNDGVWNIEDDITRDEVKLEVIEGLSALHTDT